MGDTPWRLTSALHAECRSMLHVAAATNPWLTASLKDLTVRRYKFPDAPTIPKRKSSHPCAVAPTWLVL
ncbi:MAG: hypothetical protein GWP30_01975 [Actinobacteria bacterium]|jgi:hypothetical protein|nr:hypothetical protein [Actinomycetota bacterium]